MTVASDRAAKKAQGFGSADSDYERRLQAQAAQAQAQQQQVFGQQQDAYGLLQAQATGQAGPSAAQLQAGQANQQGIVDQMGMAAQARGGSLASQQRSGAAIGAAGQMAGMQQAAQMQQAEQAQAQAAMAGQANTMGGQAGAAAANTAGLLSSTNQFLAGQAQQQGQFDTNMQFQQQQANREMGMKVAEMGLGAVQGMAMSDENVKDIETREADDEVMDALDGLAAVKYRYKGDGEYGPTDHDILGFTTQDLRRSKAGAQLVHDTERGQAFDVAGAASLGLAGLATLAKKVMKLEGASEGLAGVARG